MCSVLYLHEYEVSIPPLNSSSGKWGLLYIFVLKVGHVQVIPFPEN